MDGSFESRPRVCFEVEKVIAVSSDGSYQVQWAPAWVSKFHLVGCEHLIQEFLQQQAEKGNGDEIQTKAPHAMNNPSDSSSRFTQESKQNLDVNGRASTNYNSAHLEPTQGTDNNTEMGSYHNQQYFHEPPTTNTRRGAGESTTATFDYAKNNFQAHDRVRVKIEEEEAPDLYDTPSFATRPTESSSLPWTVNENISTGDRLTTSSNVYRKSRRNYTRSYDRTNEMFNRRKRTRVDDVVYHPRDSNNEKYEFRGSSRAHELRETTNEFYDIVDTQRAEKYDGRNLDSHGTDKHDQRETYKVTKEITNQRDTGYDTSSRPPDQRTRNVPDKCYQRDTDYNINTDLKKPDQRDTSYNNSNMELFDHRNMKLGKRHACSMCDKQFPSRSALTVHYRTHTGFKPHVCPHCKKAFSQSGNLKIHLRTHTGEKPFSCPHCGTSFAHKPSLERHAKHCGDWFDDYATMA